MSDTVDTRVVEQALVSGQGAAAFHAALELLGIAPGADPAEKIPNSRALTPIAEAIRRAYDALHVASVSQMVELLLGALSPAAMSMVMQPLTPEMELTAEWAKRLEGLAAERLSNALIDLVKFNDMKAAQLTLQTMVYGAPERERAQRAKYAATLLGGLLHEKDRASALVQSVGKAPQAFGIDAVVAVEMQEEFVRSGNAAARRERPLGSTTRAELTQAAVEISRSLPGRMVLAEPTSEQQEEFMRVLRALWRCALTSPQFDRFHDVSALLVEFSPKEVSAAGALAGVEQRLYAGMGRTGRTVAARGLEAMGATPIAFGAYLQWFQANINSKSARVGVEMLGLLKQVAAIPVLLPLLGDRKHAARQEVIFALGAIGDPSAFQALAKQLDEDLRGRVIEKEERREAFSIISALGRSTRTLDAAMRSKVAASVIRLLPKDDTEFHIRAALNFFLGKMDGIEPELLKWAAQVGTAALWNVDRPELARAGRNQMLGFRQPLVDLLGRLQPHVGSVIRQTAMECAKQYNAGAYLAMGEFWFKTPDHEALPVLKQLIFNTSLYDDSQPKSTYLQQKVLDTANDAQVEISKDKVLAALVHAVNKIDGDEAAETLAELFEQAQQGRLGTLGQETADVLMQAHLKAGNKLGARSGSAGGTAEANSVGPDDIAHLEALRARYLMAGNRRAKKVAAFAHLANRKIAAVAEIALDHLLDSDPIIANAAMTCLIDMVAGTTPDSVKEQHCSVMLTALKAGENPLRVKVGEVLFKVGPKREPWAAALVALANQPSVPLPLRAVLERLVTSADRAAASDAEGGGAPGAASVAGGAAAGGAAGGGGLSAMDKKRQYVIARQAWIKGGKKGPEPQPPE